MSRTATVKAAREVAPETRRATKLPTQYRAFAPVPDTYNADARTVDLVASAGAQVSRWGWDGPYLEELEVSAEAVDLSRVALGQCPLLDAHSACSIDDQLGMVTAARFDGPQLIVTVRFADSPRGQEVETRVAAGDLRGVSIGYAITEMMLAGEIGGVPVFRVTSWVLYEVSLVPIPADPYAGVRSADSEHPCIIIKREVGHMPPETVPAVDPATQPAPAAETRAAPTVVQPATAQPETVARFAPTAAIEFIEQARTFGVETEARALVGRNEVGEISIDAARAAILTAATERQRAAAPITPGQGSHAVIVHDERDKMRASITSALSHRYDPKNKLDDSLGAREWRGMSLLEIARRNLEQNGQRTSGLGRREIADLCLRWNSTSDFPNILANVANKTLRDGYQTAAQTFKPWSRMSTIADFKPVNRTQLGGFPNLLQVPEGGEIKMGSTSDGKETYALSTFARRFPITRQAIINDDMDAFTRLPMMAGRAAADLESDTVYGILLANPLMSDGNPLFSTAHGNLAASGAAIAQATAQAAEIAMGSQVGLEGRPINVTPAYFVGGVSTRVPAYQLIKPINATQSSNVNPYQDAFQLIIEQRLNGGANPTPWFMVADYNQIDTVEYAYLEGEDGVFLDERQGFEVEGLEFKARLDFGAKAIDWRGLYKNPGVVGG